MTIRSEGVRAAQTAAALTLIAALGCAQATRPPGGQAVSVAAGDIHEACADLEAGQTWHYQFESAAPLDFNIHFHADDQVEYPVREVDVDALEDRFTATAARTYCLMWTNLGEAPVRLDFRADIER